MSHKCKKEKQPVQWTRHKTYRLNRCRVARRSRNGAPEERFDIIICGAGTSGSLLTYRMAEKYPQAKILVLDVGQDDARVTTGTSVVPNPNTGGGAAPTDWGQLLRYTLISAFGEGASQIHSYVDPSPETQQYLKGLQMARGFTLGGTSAVNAAIWNRGTKEGTYDRWEEATGDSAFGFDAMNESYKRIENRSQDGRYFSQPYEHYWPSGTPGLYPGQMLDSRYMGNGGRIYLVNSTPALSPTNPTQFFGYSKRALFEYLSTNVLPERTAPFPLLLNDVDPTNPPECIDAMPATFYDQSDINFPSFNPYTDSDPGYTYVPPGNPANVKGPAYSGFGGGRKSAGARCYAAPAYLYPILNGQLPNNVTILDKRFVTRLLFSDSKKYEVIGVEYVEGPQGEGWQVAEVERAIRRGKAPYKFPPSLSGLPELVDMANKGSVEAAVENQANVVYKRAYAKLDVWVCLGAIDTPALLQRSGIAPRELLETLADPLEPRIDLPGVGKQVKDTCDVTLVNYMEIDLGTGLPAPEPAGLDEIFYPGLVLSDPILTNPVATASISNLPNASTSIRFKTTPASKFTDIDVLTISGGVKGLGSYLLDDLAKLPLGIPLNFDMSTTRPVYDRTKWGMWTPTPQATNLITTALMCEFWNPASFGSVEIVSGNPFSRPNYMPNMLSNQKDLDAYTNFFQNTLIPLSLGMANYRYGPRGLATYQGQATGGGANSINLLPFLLPVKPIVGNINQATYDTPGSLVGYGISIVAGSGSAAGPGAVNTNLIVAWSGAPLYTATVAVPWTTVPDGTSVYFLNPPGATPTDSVEFSDPNHRNFARFLDSDKLFSDIAVTPLTNPFTTSAGSTVVTVNHPAHGFSTGEYILISGVSGPVDNITADNFNNYHVVYVLDPNTYNIILYWNPTPLGGPGSLPTPSPAAAAVGAVGVGGSVVIHQLSFDEAKFRDWVKNIYYSGWHPCCSCRMGKPEDLMAVVDTRGRVYETLGLRCCDASVFPVKPNGNTQAPAYGIAQRLFELVTPEYDLYL